MSNYKQIRVVKDSLITGSAYSSSQYIGALYQGNAELADPQTYLIDGSKTNNDGEALGPDQWSFPFEKAGVYEFWTGSTKATASATGQFEMVYVGGKPEWGTLFVSKRKYAEYTEIATALSALPDEGGIILVDSIVVGEDTPYNGFTVTKPNVSIIGVAPAEYDFDTGGAVGTGVVIKSKVTISAPNFTIKNCTIEVLTADDCLVATGADIANHRFENCVSIGVAATDAYHCFLTEGGDGVVYDNCRAYNNVHGFAIKSSNAIVSNCQAFNNGFDNVILKADNAKTRSNIFVTNFIGRQVDTITNSGNIVIETRDNGSILENVFIKNAYISNSDAIAIELKFANASTAIMRNITLDNVVADEFRAYGFWLYGISGSNTAENVTFINCVAKSTKSTSTTVGYANGNNDLYVSTTTKRINCVCESSVDTPVIGRFIEGDRSYTYVSTKDNRRTHSTLDLAYASANTKGQGRIDMDTVLESDSSFTAPAPSYQYMHTMGRNPGVINWTTPALKGDSTRVAGNVSCSSGNLVFENLSFAVTSSLNNFFFNGISVENIKFINCNFIGFTSSSGVASVLTRYCDHIQFIRCNFLYTAIGIQVNSSNVLIDGCEFAFHNSAAIDIVSSHGTNSNIIVRNCKIRGNSTDGSGIVVSSSSTRTLQNVIIDNCLITGAKGSGIQVQQSGTTKNVQITNCIISSSVSHGINVNSGGTVVVSNCILQGNGGYGLVNSSGTVNAGGNIYDGNTSGTTSGTIGTF